VKRTVIAIMLCTCLFLAARPATVSASIIANFEGSTWTASEENIVNSAISEWTSRLVVSQDLNVYFYLTDLTGSTLGQTQILSFYKTSGLISSASITVDTGSNISWNLSSALSGYYDALTIIAHELGHALGIAYGLSHYGDPDYDSHVTVSSGKAYFDGYRLYSTSDLSHVYDSSDLMYPYLDKSIRRTVSDTDVAILSAAYGYTPVPLPTALFLIGPGFALIAAARKRLL
jgi:hypothetical protein